MTGGVSGSRFKRAFEILFRRAGLILDGQGMGYYSLVEFSDGSHYPVPMLSPIMRWLARRLRVIGRRGRDWWYHCPVCGHRSFFTLRDNMCYSCGTSYDRNNIPRYMGDWWQYVVTTEFMERVKLLNIRSFFVDVLRDGDLSSLEEVGK